MENISELVVRIAKVGRENPSQPQLSEILPFQNYFIQGSLDRSSLDKRDGSCTRRELLTRFLLLNAVLDQGPDLEGVRDLLIQVTNSLYLNEIRFLHTPLNFFKELNITIDEMIDKHQSIKQIRKNNWGKLNRTNPDKYNLFMDNSKQVLNYTVFRWGVPLALPLILERDCKEQYVKTTALIDYIENYRSAEEMSRQLKDHERYGLGKAIGNKACHLFAKWMISTFHLIRKKGLEWGPLSFEVPYDSNAGRVLWRTGYLSHWASKDDYIENAVIQEGKGKQGLNYIRVTNIRGMKTEKEISIEIRDLYDKICVDHLKTHSHKPQKMEIQRIQHAFLLNSYDQTGLGANEFDDGLIYIGTTFCFNHNDPNCNECPVKDCCEGFRSKDLIHNYRT